MCVLFVLIYPAFKKKALGEKMQYQTTFRCALYRVHKVEEAMDLVLFEFAQDLSVTRRFIRSLIAVFT